MKAYLVRGVPSSLQQDGWWMDGIDRPRRLTTQQTFHRRGLSLAGLALLAALAIIGAGLRGEEGFSDSDRSHSLGAEVRMEQTY